MKVSKLFKLVDRNTDIVIYGFNSEVPIYQGLPANTPYYLTQLEVVNIAPIGQDSYSSLSLILKRGDDNDSK